MRYDQIWEAVDKLASINGLSPSGLAKKAGLDSTTFNKSKRIRPNGKKRWPSLESINKIISVCHMSFEEFYHLANSDQNDADTCSQSDIFCYELSKFSAQHSADSLETLQKIRFPEIYQNLYAVEIDSKTAEPIYPAGSILIVTDANEIHRGDRIIIGLRSNPAAVIGEFINRTSSGIKLYNLTDNRSQTVVRMQDISHIGHILWASQ